MKRIFLALALGVVLSALAAAAASLSVNGGVIQAGSDGSLRCDTDGVTVVGWGLELDDGKVYFVRIDDIDGTCDPADMFVALYDSGGAKIGEGGPEPVSIPQTKVNLDSPVLAKDVAKITVFIEGATP